MSALTGDKDGSNILGRRISQVPLSAYACHRGREADSTIVLVSKVFDTCYGGFCFFSVAQHTLLSRCGRSSKPTDDQLSRRCQVQQQALQLFLSRGMGAEQRRQELPI